MREIPLKELMAGVAETGCSEPVRAVETDSRKVGPGSVFVAIAGERVDGHDYAAAALGAGAVAVVAERPLPGLPKGRVLVVQDSRNALIGMAGNYRARYAPLLVGITGSVGKTTTKEFCAAVFSAFGATHKTQGNQNNEIGLPRTLFGLDEGVEYAVVEMGMDHRGDLHKLALAARPAAAVITGIGVAHIENLGSQEEILKAKMEICDGLPDGGLLVVNGDDPRLAAAVPPRHIRKVQFGVDSRFAQVNAVDIKKEEGGQRFTIQDKLQGEFEARIPAVGRHNVYNALAAYTLATRLGLDPARAAAALGGYQTTGMRQRLVQEQGVQLLVDCYNANPDSMRAALEALCTVGSGRRAAVLGDMFELGSLSQQAHSEVGRLAAARQLDLLLTVGERARQITEAAKQAGLAAAVHCSGKQQAVQLLQGWCRPGDTVLFKASRGMAFEEIVEGYCGHPV